MTRSQEPAELSVERRVFESWAIRIPARFTETFVASDGYWHGYDERRSVSLTSIVVTEGRHWVSAGRILRQLPPLDGSPVAEVPTGLLGRASTSAAHHPARASRILSGMLATDGRLLVVTITSDDLDWARQVWLSIRSTASPVPEAAQRRPVA